MSGSFSYHVSVVIPTFNRCLSLRRTLHALAGQTLPAEQYEVIVSIDGSEDGTHEMVAQLDVPYRLQGIRRRNGGRAAACNTGINAATGRLIVIMDDDIEPAPHCLEAHAAAHSATAPVGVMGAVPVKLEPDSAPVAAYVRKNFDDHLARVAEPHHLFRLRDFSTQNFSIRRELLLQVGAFDESLFRVYGNEDLELSVRLRRAGVRLVYEPRALAYQYYTKDFAGLAHDNIAKGRTAVLFALKHPQVLSDLKLSQYHAGSRIWRVVRSALLSISTLFPLTTQGIITVTGFLERIMPNSLQLYYRCALDYCYWLGALQELNDRVPDRMHNTPAA